MRPALRDAVRRDEFDDLGLPQPLDGHVGEHGVGDGGVDRLRALGLADARGGGDGARRGGEVIDEEDVFAFDLADDVGGFHFGVALALFRHRG